MPAAKALASTYTASPIRMPRLGPMRSPRRPNTSAAGTPMNCTISTASISGPLPSPIDLP